MRVIQVYNNKSIFTFNKNINISCIDNVRPYDVLEELGHPITSLLNLVYNKGHLLDQMVVRVKTGCSFLILDLPHYCYVLWHTFIIGQYTWVLSTGVLFYCCQKRWIYWFYVYKCFESCWNDSQSHTDLNLGNSNWTGEQAWEWGDPAKRLLNDMKYDKYHLIIDKNNILGKGRWLCKHILSYPASLLVKRVDSSIDTVWTKQIKSMHICMATSRRTHTMLMGE